MRPRQRGDGGRQDCRVDRPRDPHPRSGRKLDLDRSVTSSSGWRRYRRLRFRDHYRRHEAFRSARNERRHCSSCEREMPYRRAVAETWRGACKLSSTILSFSSSDQRRRRPVSTTSSRST